MNVTCCPTTEGQVDDLNAIVVEVVLTGPRFLVHPL